MRLKTLFRRKYANWGIAGGVDRADTEAKGKGFIFQEDNDGGHGTRSEENSARLYKDQINLDFIDDWPAFSPDLLSIENVWYILK
jgi:hypothetical protein